MEAHYVEEDGFVVEKEFCEKGQVLSEELLQLLVRFICCSVFGIPSRPPHLSLSQSIRPSCISLPQADPLSSHIVACE